MRISQRSGRAGPEGRSRFVVRGIKLYLQSGSGYVARRQLSIPIDIGVEESIATSCQIRSQYELIVFSNYSFSQRLHWALYEELEESEIRDRCQQCLVNRESLEFTQRICDLHSNINRRLRGQPRNRVPGRVLHEVISR